MGRPKTGQAITAARKTPEELAKLRWYETLGADGLRTEKPPGGVPRRRPEQIEKLTQIIEGGPMEAGFTSGVWMDLRARRDASPAGFVVRACPRRSSFHRCGWSLVGSGQ